MNLLKADARVLPAPHNSVTGKSVRPRFTSNLATVFGGQVLCAVVGLGLEICYARLLGPAGRGQISLCKMAIALCVLVGGVGGEIPITIWTAESRRKFSEWLPAVLFWGAIGCAVTASLWATVYWQWHPEFLRGVTSPLAALVLVNIPVSIVFVYLLSMLAGLERFRQRAIASLANQVAGLIGVVSLALLVGKTPEMAILGGLFGFAVASVAAAMFLRDSLRGIGNLGSARNRLGAALSLGLRGQLGNLAAFFSYRLDVFVVNYFLDPAQVGLYAVGVVVSESLWLIPHATAVALLPRTARTIGEGATEFTCLVTRQVFAIVCVSGLAAALLSPIVIPMVFGARFGPSVPVIWWILPGTMALALGKVMAVDLTARGKPGYNSIFAFVALVATVVLDFALVPRMGIRGAALASSAAYFLDAALTAIVLKHELKVSWRYLLVPSWAELAHYPQAWLRCQQWLQSAVSANSGIAN
jgi:O-antigen/teichoic acid export membrane protein